MKLVYMTPDGEPVVRRPGTPISQEEYIYVYACETEEESAYFARMHKKELLDEFKFYETGHRYFSVTQMGCYIIFTMTIDQ